MTFVKPLNFLLPLKCSKIIIFLTAYLPEFSDRQNPENVRSHSNYSIENVTPL